jgi:hypothetical protein
MSHQTLSWITWYRCSIRHSQVQKLKIQVLVGNIISPVSPCHTISHGQNRTVPMSRNQRRRQLDAHPYKSTRTLYVLWQR